METGQAYRVRRGVGNPCSVWGHFSHVGPLTYKDSQLSIGLVTQWAV